jgi:hypothetical protein
MLNGLFTEENDMFKVVEAAKDTAFDIPLIKDSDSWKRLTVLSKLVSLDIHVVNAKNHLAYSSRGFPINIRKKVGQRGFSGAVPAVEQVKSCKFWKRAPLELPKAFVINLDELL